MNIRKAVLTDSDLVESVMVQAVLRIKAKGSNQWGHILAGEETEIIAERIKAGEVYLYGTEHAGVGVFYLYETPNDWDYSLWQEPAQSGIYYLHRLSLADGYTGKGIADQLLTELILWLSRKSHAKAVRLDCIATQGVLNELYCRNGFGYIKQVKDLQAGPIVADFNLYERPVR